MRKILEMAKDITPKALWKQGYAIISLTAWEMQRYENPLRNFKKPEWQQAVYHGLMDYMTADAKEVLIYRKAKPCNTLPIIPFSEFSANVRSDPLHLYQTCYHLINDFNAQIKKRQKKSKPEARDFLPELPFLTNKKAMKWFGQSIPSEEEVPIVVDVPVITTMASNAVISTSIADITAAEKLAGNVVGFDKLYVTESQTKKSKKT